MCYDATCVFMKKKNELQKLKLPSEPNIERKKILYHYYYVLIHEKAICNLGLCGYRCYCFDAAISRELFV